MKSCGIDAAVAIAKALGHPARMRVVAMLGGGELCVCQITEILGLAPSTVSAHLKELKRSGLVSERKDGRWSYVSLAEDGPARSWIATAVTAAGEDPQLIEDRGQVTLLRRVPVEVLCRAGMAGVRAELDDVHDAADAMVEV